MTKLLRGILTRSLRGILTKILADELRVDVGFKLLEEEIEAKLSAGEIEGDVAGRLLSELQQLITNEIIEKFSAGKIEGDVASRLISEVQQLMTNKIMKKLVAGKTKVSDAARLFAEFLQHETTTGGTPARGATMAISDWARTRGIRLFHFTSRANLDGIRIHGLLSWAASRERNVHVNKPGGDDLSHELDREGGTLDFVHLCFVDKHQMEHHARETGRIRDAVFLSIDLSVLDADGVRFSNMNATDSDVDFGQGLEWFQTHIKWQLIVDRRIGDGPAMFWGHPPFYPPEKHQWQAEALVPKRIDPEYIKFPDPPSALEDFLKWLDA